ncbi:MAG TPA: flavodoxin domain-containing protein [Ktedonobacterales bacterium]|nr:flavodoxin domain-containing protein [Ktedonobacterales bacterium]
MTILVTYASKHGATQGIAERVTRTLQRLGMEAEFRQVESVTDLESYSAVVIGSAVYYGSWMKEASEFVRRNRTVLAARPVWLFSSGPLGAEVKDDEPQPKELREMQEAIHPRDHHIFFGALDHNQLSFMERMVVKGVRAPEGDYRDWNEIEAWAESIVRALVPQGIALRQM